MTLQHQPWLLVSAPQQSPKWRSRHLSVVRGGWFAETARATTEAGQMLGKADQAASCKAVTFAVCTGHLIYCLISAKLHSDPVRKAQADLISVTMEPAFNLSYHEAFLYQGSNKHNILVPNSCARCVSDFIFFQSLENNTAYLPFITYLSHKTNRNK